MNTNIPDAETARVDAEETMITLNSRPPSTPPNGGGKPYPDPVGSDTPLLLETISALRSTASAITELTGEIRAERASRDADRAAMSRSREAMDRIVAIGEEHRRIADERARKADATEEIRIRSENEARKTRAGMIKATGAWIGGILKQPLTLVLAALAGFVAASYFSGPSQVGTGKPEAVQVDQP